MSQRRGGLLARLVAMLRGGPGAAQRAAAGAASKHAGGNLAGPMALPADRGADSAPDASLRAAGAVASRALWRHALGVSGDQQVDARRVRELRPAVERVLAGEPAERYFPRRPLLMPQLMAVVHDPAAAATRLADIIARDPVLAGNVLRLANSAWYRVTQDPVETLQRAVIVCGTDGLQSLAALAIMQPVFRAAGTRFARLPVLLWERTTRATLAAELYAQRVCPGERHGAQLLVLLRALGPLLVYRIVEEQLRARPAGAGEALACAALLEECGGHVAARVATRWDSSARICAVLAQLDSQRDSPPADEEQRDLAAAVEVGELLGSASLLIGERAWDSAAGLRIATESGMPRDWMLATLTRLARSG
ncbi:MAG: HDOD domain-containing protein [Gammaproteobacteria bacterium]|nr:HDOD domain-containing protein [Gammaproteobacteria bacterium]